jgi:hypothetical protein
MTSDTLINVSDRYVDLDGVKDDIRKTSRNGSANSYTYRPLSSIAVLDEAEVRS